MKKFLIVIVLVFFALFGFSTNTYAHQNNQGNIAELQNDWDMTVTTGLLPGCANRMLIVTIDVSLTNGALLGNSGFVVEGVYSNANFWGTNQKCGMIEQGYAEMTNPFRVLSSYDKYGTLGIFRPDRELFLFPNIASENTVYTLAWHYDFNVTSTTIINWFVDNVRIVPTIGSLTNEWYNFVFDAGRSFGQLETNESNAIIIEALQQQIIDIQTQQIIVIDALNQQLIDLQQQQLIDLDALNLLHAEALAELGIQHTQQLQEARENQEGLISFIPRIFGAFTALFLSITGVEVFGISYLSVFVMFATLALALIVLKLFRG